MKAQDSLPLPKGWSIATIGSVCSKPQYGWTTSGVEAGDVRLLRTTDITRGPIDWDKVPYCRDPPPDVDKYLLRDGDIVVSRAGSVGVSSRVCSPERSVFASYLIRFRPTEAVDGGYLAYVLQSPAYWTQVRGSTAGIALPNINASKLEAFSFPLAPLREQAKIVAEIEKQFTRLDAGVASLGRVQANLKRYRAAVLKAACEGRLVPTEAELARKEGRTFESGEALLNRVLKSRRQRWKSEAKYKEPIGPETALLPPLPNGWTWSTPDQLSTAEEGSICAGPFGTIFKARDFRPEGVPIIFLRHVAPGRYLTHKPGFMDRGKWEELFRSYSVYGGELLVTKLGEPPGVCAIYPSGIGPAMVTPDVMKMTPNSSATLPTFLMHYFNSQTARDFATGAAFGTTRLRLTLPIFRAMPVPLPPFAEQVRIVGEVERRLSVVQELDATVSGGLQRVMRLRQSILAHSFGSY